MYWLIEDGSGRLPKTVWQAEDSIKALAWFEICYPESWAAQITRCNPEDGELQDPYELLGVYDMLEQHEPDESDMNCDWDDQECGWCHDVGLYD